MVHMSLESLSALAKNCLFGHIFCHQQCFISADGRMVCSPSYNFSFFQMYCQQLDKIEKINKNVFFLHSSVIQPFTISYISRENEKTKNWIFN